MPAPAAVIALLALPWMSPGVVHTHGQTVAGWRLTVTEDSFARQTTCLLRRAKASYGRQALTLHLPQRVDAFTAVYRVDGGAPVQARADEIELAHLGFTLNADHLNNPSGGLVRIPVKRVTGAREVSVKTERQRHPESFRIEGLDKALAAAKAAGCKDDSFEG